YNLFLSAYLLEWSCKNFFSDWVQRFFVINNLGSCPPRLSFPARCGLKPLSITISNHYTLAVCILFNVIRTLFVLVSFHIPTYLFFLKVCSRISLTTKDNIPIHAYDITYSNM